MPTAIGKILRRAEFWREGEKSLLADISLPGALGAMPGLEVPAKAVSTLAPLVDGLIVNPGLAEKHADAFVGKLGAVPLVRLDWTNAHRPADFVLPPTQIHRVSLGTAEDAVQIGACATVVSFLLGYDEDFEARNVQSISFLARECARVALPLLTEVCLVGPKVDPAKFDGAVQLGVSFMVEGGADGVVIPLPGAEALELLLQFSPVPLFIKVENTVGAQHAVALRMGCAGLCLGSHALADPKRVTEQARVVLVEGVEGGP